MTTPTETINGFDQRWQHIQSFWKDERATYELLGGIALVLIGLWFGVNVFGASPAEELGYWTNVFTEGLGVLVTIFVVNWFAARRDIRNRRKSLISQMYSQSSDFAVDAIRQLRDSGWLDTILQEEGDLGRVQWKGVDLRDVDLRGLYLGMANLQNAVLWGTDLRAAQLSGADLRDATLFGTNLNGANLQDADLRGAKLFRAKLEGCVLRDVNLTDTDLRHVDLNGAIFRGANLRGVNLRLSELQDLNLSEINFQGADLSLCNLEKASLLSTVLRSANLFKSNLQGAALLSANLQGANLRKANLQGAKLQGANLVEAHLTDAEFDENTILPDAERVFANEKRPYNKYWTPDTDMARYTDPEHPDFWQPNWAKSGHSNHSEWYLAGQPTEQF